MFDRATPRRNLLVLLAASAAGLLAIAPASAQAMASGKVMANPRDVMVNTTTTLKGKGFPANTTIKLRECGKKSWLDPAYPCLEENGKSVVTNAKGRFETTFEVRYCPEAERAKRPTTVVCYIGSLETGEDTGELAGAARLLVSYP
ncbi:MAG TPA: hypothetical protein VNV44_11375 [Solirubrobacteraceae bacterium]|jgi:hypothetical protein|nr:hypothetical protein [Solirubrobacteraceae bacterium]